MEYILGFDIGGTKCAVSVGEVDNGNIKILKRQEVPTTFNPIETLEMFRPFILDAIKTYKIKKAGISCGGPLNSTEGKLYVVANLKGWDYFEIVKYVEKEYSIKAYLQNDANACALAEWKFGAGRGTNNMIFITFGTGLGSGLILDGKLYSGTNDNAGECGHIRMRKSGPIGFGKKGSLEGFSSGGGITRLALLMAKKEKKTPKIILENGENKLSTKLLAEYAHKGDDFAIKVFNKSAKILGEGLSILIDVLNPQKIVIGGVFMRSKDLIIPKMQKTIKREALCFSEQVCEIVPAMLSENIGDFGAICVGINENN